MGIYLPPLIIIDTNFNPFANHVGSTLKINLESEDFYPLHYCHLLKATLLSYMDDDDNNNNSSYYYF